MSWARHPALEMMSSNFAIDKQAKSEVAPNSF
jgi:hypothetical protein